MPRYVYKVQPVICQDVEVLEFDVVGFVCVGSAAEIGGGTIILLPVPGEGVQVDFVIEIEVAGDRRPVWDLGDK